jgi:hypothetical protein
MKKFTDEQIEDLQFYLKKFDADQVKNFIHFADWLLDMSWHSVAKQADIKDFHYQMDKIIDQVAKMEAKTRDLEKYHLPGHPDITTVRNETLKNVKALVPEKWEQNDSDIHIEEIQLHKDARVATDSLIKLKTSLQTVLKKYTRDKRGRKKGDHYGICLNVGYLYFKKFDKMPTTTKNGPFIEVLKTFLDALDLPCADPMRLVKSSLPELKGGLEKERK